MKSLLLHAVSACVLLTISTTGSAQLFDRGGGLIYDDHFDITWLQDADYAATLDEIAFPGGGGDGQVAHVFALNLADTLVYYDAVRDVSYDDWRLPTTLLSDASCSGTLSEGSGCTGSEMGHLSNVDGISSTSPGPFINIHQSGHYWSSDEIVLAPSFIGKYNYTFGMPGGQAFYIEVGTLSDRIGRYAMFVRSGDVSAAPMPPVTSVPSVSIPLLVLFSISIMFVGIRVIGKRVVQRI